MGSVQTAQLAEEHMVNPGGAARQSLGSLRLHVEGRRAAKWPTRGAHPQNPVRPHLLG